MFYRCVLCLIPCIAHTPVPGPEKTKEVILLCFHDISEFVVSWKRMEKCHSSSMQSYTNSVSMCFLELWTPVEVMWNGGRSGLQKEGNSQHRICSTMQRQIGSFKSQKVFPALSITVLSEMKVSLAIMWNYCDMFPCQLTGKVPPINLRNLKQTPDCIKRCFWFQVNHTNVILNHD